MITTEQKKKITAAIERNRALYESDSKHAKVLGISTSVYSMVKQGQTDKALSDANWVRLARRLDVSLKHEMDWQTARTETFVTITQQMEMVQGSATSPTSARPTPPDSISRPTRRPSTSTARR